MLHKAFLGVPSKGDKIKSAYLTPAFSGAASGRKCCVTLALSGDPNKRDKFFGRLRCHPMYGR